MKKITLHFILNEEPVSLEIDENARLLDVIRDVAGLTGTKEGCGVGECGACTVILEGEAVDSCIVLAASVEGKHVTTVEGLAKNGKLDPVQQAVLDHHALQCGFCTPGLIMSAVEIVGTGKRYNREELKKLISGHLCRCTGYENILNAMERIVEETYRVVGE